MIDFSPLFAVLIGVVILMTLILKCKIQPFLSLLIASISVGVLAGMPPEKIIESMQEGMGNTLGFVATLVGLGALFGAILEQSGGALSLADYLLKKFGEKRASWAMVICGFFIAIPVFFDVAFIILIPVVYSLQRKTKKSILLYAMPLLAGLAITHAFIPPTPGPIAVADIIGADLGWVILFGFIIGIPTAVISGPLFASYISKKIYVAAPEQLTASNTTDSPPAVMGIFLIIGVPIVLIVLNTLINCALLPQEFIPMLVKSTFSLIGHPFSALIIANLIAWYFLGIRRKNSKAKLLEISTKAMAPAGIIILLTGAGGVFKQMLINTEAGLMLATFFADKGISIFLFSFISAVLVRLLQGSATVAMITAAGLCAPLISQDMSDIQKALLVISIASGASILSHVNDSGFWLVSKYLGLNEVQTFKSWSMMTTLIAVVGFVCSYLLSLLF